MTSFDIEGELYIKFIDKAVEFATGGYFSSAQDVINDMVRSRLNYPAGDEGSLQWLKMEMGIDFTNDDTGAGDDNIHSTSLKVIQAHNREIAFANYSNGDRANKISRPNLREYRVAQKQSRPCVFVRKYQRHV